MVWPLMVPPGSKTWPQLIVQVSQGSNGDAVRAVQSQLHSRGAGAAITVDGVFGRVSVENAVVAPVYAADQIQFT